MMFCVFNNYTKLAVLFLGLVLVSFINPVIPFPMSNNAIGHNDSIVSVNLALKEVVGKERVKRLETLECDLKDFYTGRMGSRHI